MNILGLTWFMAAAGRAKPPAAMLARERDWLDW